MKTTESIAIVASAPSRVYFSRPTRPLKNKLSLGSITCPGSLGIISALP